MTIQNEVITHDLNDVMKERIKIATDVEHILSLDRAELISWQRNALFNNVSHACDNSPFYKQHIPTDLLHSFKKDDSDWLQEMPFTTRDDIMNQYPFGFLAAPTEEVIRFNESSGTSTGKSLSAYFTSKDWLINNNTVAHFLSAVLTPEDCVAVAVPYELAGVGQDIDRSLELINCTIVALGALTQFCPPERMVKIMRNANVTTLICSGTRALYLAEVARKQGLDPKVDFNIDKILFAGEGASPAKRKKLSDIWGAKVYAMYGMTETNTLAMFCTENQLHLVENRTLFEVIDPKTNQPVADGYKGELTVTSLCSEAMPLIRYRTGDNCIIDDKPCGCGSSFRILRHQGRSTDTISIMGQSISQLQLEDAIMSQLEHAPYYFSFNALENKLLVGLTTNNLTPNITQAIKDEVYKRFKLAVDFSEIEEAIFSEGLRNAVKPTMQHYLMNQKDAHSE